MDAREAIAMPNNLSWEEAGSVTLAFMVVHDMLVAQGSSRRGNGCSSPAYRPASGSPRCRPLALGAKVIGTSGSAEKLEKLKAMGLDVASARAPRISPKR